MMRVAASALRGGWWVRSVTGSVTAARAAVPPPSTSGSSVRRWAVVGARCMSSTAQGSGDGQFRVAVVGTGPGGFYAAKYLLRDLPGVTVDMIDRMPVPYGLVRFGVAPDHPEVKSVMNDFSAVAADAGDRFNFLGNVDVGTDVSVEELRKYYNAVILATGAQSDTKLGIPGEELGNVFSARAFVNWYNGHPDFVDLNPDLSVEHVVVVGNGNVAIDCARVLAKTAAELASTDITDHALAALAESKVRRVTVLGRRGHVQAAFTMKELRELTRLDSAQFVVDAGELEAGLTEASVEETKQHRAKKRMNELLGKNAAPDAVANLDTDLAANPDRRQLALRFLRSPVELLADGGVTDRVGKVRCVVNSLSGEANKQRASAVEGQEEVVPAGMVLQSIGYKSVPLPGVPFHEDANVINNWCGVVVDDEGEPVPGLYCSGWVKRGPSGIIGTNIPDSRETVASLIKDAQDGSLPGVTIAGGAHALQQALVASGVKADGGTVDWSGYMRIEAEERRRGEAAGRPFAKFVHVADMLAVAHSTPAQ